MWKNISVGKFQQIWDIVNGNFQLAIEKKLHMLSCIEGHPISYYESLPMQQLIEQCRKVDFLSVDHIPPIPPPTIINIGKQAFKPVYEFKNVCAGQFIDIMSIAKTANEQILNMHKILSAICLPVLNKKIQPYGSIPFDEVAECMLNLPIIEAHAIAVFFCHVWTSYLKNIPAFLEKKMKKRQKLTETELLIYGLALTSAGGGC